MSSCQYTRLGLVASGGEHALDESGFVEVRR